LLGLVAVKYQCLIAKAVFLPQQIATLASAITIVKSLQLSVSLVIELFPTVLSARHAMPAQTALTISSQSISTNNVSHVPNFSINANDATLLGFV
jgi:hypothetical protein